MPISVLALLMTFLFGSAAVKAGAESVREFQTAEGLVRISAAPASPGETASDPLEIPAPVLRVDTLTDLTVLPALDGRSDPLFEVYFLDSRTGEELRFPAKLSQLLDFLRTRGGTPAGGTPDSRSVAMVREMTREFQVHMRAPGAEETK
jgi:hypothetical protein